MAGANAEAVDANAPRTIADRNFMLLMYLGTGNSYVVVVAIRREMNK